MLARQGGDAEVRAEAALVEAEADLAEAAADLAEAADSVAEDLAVDEEEAVAAGVDRAIPMRVGQIEPMRDS